MIEAGASVQPAVVVLRVAAKLSGEAGRSASILALVCLAAGNVYAQAPALTNMAATSITPWSATLGGDLTNGVAGAGNTVIIYWGPVNGGTNQASWSNNNSLGLISTGVFSSGITGLISNKTYYYRCYASNVSGEAWAPTFSSFKTLTGYPYKQWTRIMGGSSYDYGYAVCADSARNVYSAGCTFGTFDSQTNMGFTDLCLTKYSSDGTRLWSRIWGSSGFDYGQALAIDSANNTYVAGYTDNGFDGQANSGGNDLCLTKHSSGGAKQWTRIWGSGNDDYAQSASVDGAGNVYVAGYTLGAFDGQTNTGYWDFCLTKYNSSGTKQWSRIWGSPDYDMALAVAVDTTGNIYVAGQTKGSIDGQSPAGDWDICLTKFNSAGTRVWSKLWGSIRTDWGSGLAIALGSVYVSGYTDGSFDGQSNNGGNDFFVTRLTTDGTRLWSRIWGSATNDTAYAASADPAGNVCVSGCTEGAFDGQSNAGGWDLCMSKVSSDGVRKWSRIWGSSSNETAYGGSVDNTFSILVGGCTLGAFDSQTNAGIVDFCVSKWIDPSPAVIDNLAPSSVTTNSGVMNGELLNNGNAGALPFIWCYWGLTDGGTNRAAWATNKSLGALDVGPVSNSVSGLPKNTTYYYRFFTSNMIGMAWAPASTNLHTGPDYDADGMDDSWEVAYFGSATNADAATDHDSDGILDVNEWIAGTVPTSALSYFEVDGVGQAASTGGFVVYWNSSVGRLYNVYSRTNLILQGWITNASGLAGTGGQMSWTNSGSAPEKHFKLGVRKP